MSKGGREFLVLAMDIGTSSSRAALFDNHGRRLRQTSAAEQYAVRYGPDGRAELSPRELFCAVTRARDQTMRAHRSSRKINRLPIKAVTGSALWHGLLGLNRRHQPVTPVFTWADSRAAIDARRLRERFDERTIQQRTGCMLRATFWPAKMLWLRRTQPKFFRQVKYWVSPSDWIFHRLFGDLGCSASMASGTGLYNLRSKTWDRELMEACRINEASVPTISAELVPPSPRQTPIETIFCPIGDGAASNLGSGADEAGA